jgi:transcriptional regulator with XRE-family HTH domain
VSSGFLSFLDIFIDFFSYLRYTSKEGIMKERLKSLRKALEMNQSEFSKGLEMAQNSYSQIETGQISLTDKNMVLICLKYGVNEKWLRNGDGEMFIAKELAETTEEKELLAISRRLSDEMREFFLDMGRKLAKTETKRAETQGSPPSQNAPESATTPLEAAQEDEKGSIRSRAGISRDPPASLDLVVRTGNQTGRLAPPLNF